MVFGAVVFDLAPGWASEGVAGLVSVGAAVAACLAASLAVLWAALRARGRSRRERMRRELRKKARRARFDESVRQFLKRREKEARKLRHGKGR